MAENVLLIQEINALRKELYASQGEVKQLEGTLKTTRTLADMRGQTLPSKEETLRLSGALNTTARQLHEQDQTERIIDMQKQEIRYVLSHTHPHTHAHTLHTHIHPHRRAIKFCCLAHHAGVCLADACGMRYATWNS
jgi:hypothetical protein